MQAILYHEFTISSATASSSAVSSPSCALPRLPIDSWAYTFHACAKCYLPLEEATHAVDVIYLATEVHDQVFLVDELLSMGCRGDDPTLRTVDGHELYQAISKIRGLIDWDECPTLKERIDLADQSRAQPTSSDDSLPNEEREENDVR